MKSFSVKPLRIIMFYNGSCSPLGKEIVTYDHSPAYHLNQLSLTITNTKNTSLGMMGVMSLYITIGAITTPGANQSPTEIIPYSFGSLLSSTGMWAAAQWPYPLQYERFDRYGTLSFPSETITSITTTTIMEYYSFHLKTFHYACFTCGHSYVITHCFVQFGGKRSFL